MAQPVIKTSMGEFAVSEHFTDAVGLNGRISIEGTECTLNVRVRRTRDKLRIEGLSLLRKNIDWNKLKNPTRADVYVLPSPSLRRELTAAILHAAESFVTEHPTFFEEAGRRWLKDEVDYIEENLKEAEEAFVNVREALARMKAFTRSPDKSAVYSERKWRWRA